jgi:hypothetical protein
MDALAMAIQGKRIGYPDGMIVTELETYEYEYTKDGVVYTTSGLHDDCVCALALAVRKSESAARAPKFFVRLGG